MLAVFKKLKYIEYFAKHQSNKKENKYLNKSGRTDFVLSPPCRALNYVIERNNN